MAQNSAVDRRRALSMDVAAINVFLAELWQWPLDDVRLQLKQNLRASIPAK